MEEAILQEKLSSMVQSGCERARESTSSKWEAEHIRSKLPFFLTLRCCLSACHLT